jgi:hypothetical protein
MSDEFERRRRERLAAINTNPKDRAGLEAEHGRVWNTAELTSEYEVIGFAAPYVVVRRKADGVVGSMEFQHSPRMYFNFEPDEPRASSLCGWCHQANPTTVRACRSCGHDAQRARQLCRCERCLTGKPVEVTAGDVEATLAWLRRRSEQTTRPADGASGKGNDGDEGRAT